MVPYLEVSLAKMHLKMPGFKFYTRYNSDKDIPVPVFLSLAVVQCHVCTLLQAETFEVD